MTWVDNYQIGMHFKSVDKDSKMRPRSDNYKPLVDMDNTEQGNQKSSKYRFVTHAQFTKVQEWIQNLPIVLRAKMPKKCPQ